MADGFISDLNKRSGEGSIRLDAGNLENALEFVVAEEANLDRSLAGPVAEVHLGTEALLELVFQVHHVHIPRWRRRDRALLQVGRRGLPLQLIHKLLSLADAPTVRDDSVSRRLLVRRRTQSKDDLGVP